MIFLAWWACATPTPTEGREAPSPYGFSAAEAVDRYVLVSLLGEVVPAPGAQTRLGTRIDARLDAWLVDPGDAVTVGAPLARVSSPALDAMRRERDGRRAVRDQATARREAGVASEAERLLAEADLAAIDARWAAVRLDLTQVDGGWTWTSPVSGRVASLDGQPGDPVGPAAPCITVVDDAGVRVTVDAPDRVLAQWVTPEAALFLPDMASPIPLRWLADAPSLAPGSRTRRSWWAPVDPDAAAPSALLPGRAGRVAVTVPAPDGAVRVPARALTRLDGDDVIFVGEDAAPVAVQRLGTQGEDAVVVGDGVGAGDRVLVRGLLARVASLTLAEDEE